MIVNGREVDITKNLGEALTSLRLSDRARILWVDAICINQMDQAEKSVLVGGMGNVYRHADTVVIFLGLPNWRSQGKVEKNTLNRSDAPTDTSKSHDKPSGTDNSDESINDPSNPFFDFLDRDAQHVAMTADNAENVIAAVGMNIVAVLTSFIDFCQREWWTRVWVLQEHFVATCESRWYVGRRNVGSDRLCRDIQAIATAADRVFSPLRGDKTFADGLGIETIGSLADMLFNICDGALNRQMTKPYNTPRLFFAKHGRSATDPRDHVFGVRELLEPHFRRVFVPDYGVCTARLFERLAAWLLLMDGWGDMFWYYPFRLENARDLPSWVPDFARRPAKLVNEREPPRYLADGPKSVDCAIVDRRLYVEACHLDVVEEVFPVPDGGHWGVLQCMWRMDRLFCSNQRGDPVPGKEWADRTLFAWATTTQPTTISLAPRSRELRNFLNIGFQGHLKQAEAVCQKLLDMEYKVAKMVATKEKETKKAQEKEPQTTEPAAYKNEANTGEVAAKGGASRGGPALEKYLVSADILAAYQRDINSMIRLHRFLIQEMEGDFASACVFDYENLVGQLLTVYTATTAQQGVDKLLSRAGRRDLVYVDLVRAVEKNSCDVAMFRTFVWVILCIAEKIHEWRDLPATSIRKEVEERKVILRKLEDKSGHPDEQARRREAVRKATEAALDAEFKDGNLRERVDNAKDATWDRIDKERAAQFRSREFFCTRTGLFGLAGPGVRGIRQGDSVALLDGLTFPLVVRRRGNSTVEVVGCANIRGLKLQHKVEDAQLPEGAVVGAKETLVIA